MRNIDYIVLHCTATPIDASIDAIQDYWRKNLGWKSPGYHYVIEYNGRIFNLLSEDKVSNGVAGFNHNSIHISYIGGIDANGKGLDTRSEAQKNAQLFLIDMLRQKYPNAKIQGHRDFPNVHKECPSFDVKKWLELDYVKNYFKRLRSY